MGNDGTKNEKRKVVRRDPEKRRHQNLQAQKKYREKMRKRLDDLETLAASVAKTRETTAKVTDEAAASLVTLTDDQTPSPDESNQVWSLTRCFEERRARQGTQTSSTTPSSDHTSAKQTPKEWDSELVIDPSYLTMTNYDRDDAHKELWHKSYVDCGCAVRHVEIRTRELGCHHNGIEILSIGAWSMKVDPYANHIRMEVVCTISAMLENSLQLGTREAILCDDDSLSPFYRPSPSVYCITNGETEAVDGVVRTVQSIWKTLKPDIRPIKEQITIPHHPCLDIVPFPTVRRNLLSGAVVVDEDEFFEDALSGLVCWGGAGLAIRDRNAATGKASTGTPWDHRSWEARPWFIRKYWPVLGGEDGELVRQSEWWRSTRGEVVDIWAMEINEPITRYRHPCGAH